MKGKHFWNFRHGFMILLILLENRHTECSRRLCGSELASDEMSKKNFDDIRNIISASLTANDEQQPHHRATIINNENNKRDASMSDRTNDKSSIGDDPENDDNVVAKESKDTLSYDDEETPEGEDDDDAGGQQHERQVNDAEYKRSKVSVGKPVEESIDQSESANYDDSDEKNADKDVAKREARNEDDYDEDDIEVRPERADSSIVTNDRSNKSDSKVANRSDLNETNPSGGDRMNNSRDTRAILDEADLDYEKEIEDQIQRRIDTIKEDIKREIEMKQRIREIEANNAKFDRLEFPSEDDEVGADESSDSSKRSLSDDTGVSKESEFNTREKRRSDLDDDEVRREDEKMLALPVKKRSYARRVTLIEKRDTTRKRKGRSSILIPERGHAEVKDDLPADLILDPNLRIARSYAKDRETEKSRPARSAEMLRKSNEYRYRRDMPGEFDDKVNDIPVESSNFLFAPAREKSNPRGRRSGRRRVGDRTRSIDRGKGRKHQRHSRRHRAMREPSMGNGYDDAEDRNKRAMSPDEDAALEYKESFGGFQSESGGGFGRFKRIKRTAMIP